MRRLPQEARPRRSRYGKARHHDPAIHSRRLHAWGHQQGADAARQATCRRTGRTGRRCSPARWARPTPMGGSWTAWAAASRPCPRSAFMAPSERDDADIDYTFAQVHRSRRPRVDYKGNCGNMSSAVGPFAVDEGLVRPERRQCHRPHLQHQHQARSSTAPLPLEEGRARYDGDLAIPGVGGTGVADPARLRATRRRHHRASLLPSGQPLKEIARCPRLRARMEVSLVDAANAAVFIRAKDVGLTGTRASG